ncbi:energy transducer TonB [Chryseobacterium sp. 5_R23647]|uniref:energy transducer TonB n=1 Tax=Chryseobacterium sp. 5_R23647 TaxID=2258964 RepID=UPI000E2223BD|nr:hypothetical protein [Chryseobacterium sp. 5_R23647]REC44428.1 hypothetical protein DRF69_05770 [Chryseobacterium sp. 5_R23647]
MKIIVFILFTNLIFAQTIPEPRQSFENSPTNDEETKINEDLKEALLPFVEIEKYGLGFIKFNATEDYSYTGASFSIFNPSKKTIKYIWFTVAGENAVGDLVKLPNGTYYKTLKGIGPVENAQIGQWSYDYVWLTDVVEYLKVSTIKIQYMDGTFKTIKYNSKMYIGEEAYEKVLIALNKKSNIKEAASIEVISANDPTVFTDVEMMAEFPGGINAFRGLIKTKLIESNILGVNNDNLKTDVSFIIEKDGSLSDIKAEGLNSEFNNATIQTIKNIRNKWAHAKINLVAVRSLYKLAITIDNK